MAEVAGVVLAAGEGRRFGMPKALVEYDGALLVDRAARVLANGGCSPIVVVLGASADEVRRRAALDGVQTVVNPDWSTGMGSSLRAALDALASTPDTVVAALVVPVDTPGITPRAVDRVTTDAAPSSLVAASYGGRRGHPVLLGRDHWSGVRATAVGDAGAREYLSRHEPVLVACDDVADGFDVDRPEDLGRHNP
jgi:nicotine blue oxidoreductase